MKIIYPFFFKKLKESK